MAAPGPVADLHCVLFSRLGAQPTLKARLIGAIDQRLSPINLIPAWRVMWWTLVAAARGRPRVIGELLAAAARSIGMRRELRARLRLLADAEEPGLRQARSRLLRQIWQHDLDPGSRVLLGRIPFQPKISHEPADGERHGLPNPV